jgi:hypothetical protein
MELGKEFGKSIETKEIKLMQYGIKYEREQEMTKECFTYAVFHSNGMIYLFSYAYKEKYKMGKFVAEPHNCTEEMKKIDEVVHMEQEILEKLQRKYLEKTRLRKLF